MNGRKKELKQQLACSETTRDGGKSISYDNLLDVNVCNMQD